MFAGKRHLDDNRTHPPVPGGPWAGGAGGQRRSAAAPPGPLPGVRRPLRGAQNRVRRNARGRHRGSRGRVFADRMERQRDRILRRVDALHRAPGAAVPRRRPERARGAAAPRAPPVGRGGGGRGPARRPDAGRMVFNGGDARATADARQRRHAGAVAGPHTSGADDAGAAHRARLNDDQFLSEIELATAAPRTRNCAPSTPSRSKSRATCRERGKD